MTREAASPFTRTGVLGVLVIGFSAFLALLYFIAVGDPGFDETNNGRAHAASNGMTGFSALTDLVKADGYDVTLSRNPGSLETMDLLVLTPPHYFDPEKFAQIIDERESLGPTLVILPKWHSFPVNRFIEVEDQDDVRDGWTILTDLGSPDWMDALEGPLKLDIKPNGAVRQTAITAQPNQSGGENADGDATDTSAADADTEQLILEQRDTRTFQDLAIDTSAAATGFSTRDPLPGLSGALPSPFGFYAEPNERQNTLVVDEQGRAIALSVRQYFGYEGEDAEDGEAEDNDAEDAEDYQWVVYVVEPDLMNNWGLSDQDRARTAISIVRNMNYGEFDAVVFDLTLNGFGGSMNLLTLAFQPPFLAATICLLLAMLIIGWRAFLRFGPSAVSDRETAFGKARLVTNGADLIMRAGRLGLLAEPFIQLTARRTARALGLAKPDPEAIDAALAGRDPQAASFTARANDLRSATKPADILRAAQALGQHTQTH